MAAGFGKKCIWQIEAWGHSAVAMLMRVLPAASVFRFGELIGKLLWPVMKSRRNTIVRNLRIACAPIGIEEAEKMAKESFVRTVANLLSSSISPKSKGGKAEDMLTVENPEVLEEAIAQGRGVVLLLAHMGNWELLTRLTRFFPRGIKSGAFYRPLNNLILNERVLRMRQAEGARLFSKRDSLHQVGGFLRENGVIGILADQRVGRKGEVVSFFGRITRASPLPSLLARRCNSEVLAFSLKTTAPGKWIARYHRVEKPYHSQNCMNALEAAMKVSLIDCFWLQERWKVYFSKRFTLRDWFKKDEARSEKRHRAIVWASEGDEPYQLQSDFIHGDLEWIHVSGKKPQALEELDRSELLPIDFVLTKKNNPELLKVAKSLGIPAISYPEFRIIRQ